MCGSLVEQLADQGLDARHAGLAAHHDDLIDLRRGDAGIGHGLLAGADGALQNVFHHLLEARPGQLHLQVLGTGGVGGDKGQIDVGFEQRGKLHLGLFGSLLEALEGHLVLGEVDAVFLLELADDPIDDALVDVVAAQVGVAVGGLDFDHAFAHFENRDIEGAAAEIVDGDGFVLLLIEAVSQRGRRGLVDDAHDFQTGDLAGVLGGLALRVVEVGRDGDHGLGDLFAQIGLGGFLQLGQDHRRDFGRGVLLARDVHAGVGVLAADRLVGDHLHLFVDFVEAAPHETLDGENRVFGVGDGLPFGDLPDQPLATLGKRHNGRSGAIALPDLQ